MLMLKYIATYRRPRDDTWQILQPEEGAGLGGAPLLEANQFCIEVEGVKPRKQISSWRLYGLLLFLLSVAVLAWGLNTHTHTFKSGGAGHGCEGGFYWEINQSCEALRPHGSICFTNKQCIGICHWGNDTCMPEVPTGTPCHRDDYCGTGVCSPFSLTCQPFRALGSTCCATGYLHCGCDPEEGFCSQTSRPRVCVPYLKAGEKCGKPILHRDFAFGIERESFQRVWPYISLRTRWRMECAPGLVCAWNGTCCQPGLAERPCNIPADCAEGLWCSRRERKCKIARTLGERCTLEDSLRGLTKKDEPLENIPCAAGLFCNVANNTCSLMNGLPDGAFCRTDSDCISAMCGDDYTCTPRHRLGERCFYRSREGIEERLQQLRTHRRDIVNGSGTCRFDLLCWFVNYTCVPRLMTGNATQYCGSCRPTEFCDWDSKNRRSLVHRETLGRCLLKLPAGPAPCLQDNMCGSGHCRKTRDFKTFCVPKAAPGDTCSRGGCGRYDHKHGPQQSLHCIAGLCRPDYYLSAGDSCERPGPEGSKDCSTELCWQGNWTCQVRAPDDGSAGFCAHDVQMTKSFCFHGMSHRSNASAGAFCANGGHCASGFCLDQVCQERRGLAAGSNCTDLPDLCEGFCSYGPGRQICVEPQRVDGSLCRNELHCHRGLQCVEEKAELAEDKKYIRSYCRPEQRHEMPMGSPCGQDLLKIHRRSWFQADYEPTSLCAEGLFCWEVGWRPSTCQPRSNGSQGSACNPIRFSHFSDYLLDVQTCAIDLFCSKKGICTKFGSGECVVSEDCGESEFCYRINGTCQPERFNGSRFALCNANAHCNLSRSVRNPTHCDQRWQHCH